MPVRLNRTFALSLAPVLLACAAATASAASGPHGVWIDHTGRGAVEITDCSGALCGRVVWLKDAADEEGCNMQIIGNVKPVAGGKWDGGWIWDPERRSKFDVELTPIGEQKLKVHGYAGMKLFGETMTWTRAPADLQRCGTAKTATAPAEPQKIAPAAQQPQQQAEPAAAQRQPEPRAAEAPAEKTQPESEPRGEAASLPDALGKMFQFSERPAGGKQKTCTVSMKDFGKFSFPC
jgi:uncharacterized protein (DUF2147 family)